jgi:hypothetical protein
VTGDQLAVRVKVTDLRAAVSESHVISE